MIDAILKRFESPDEVRTFDKGRFDIVRLGGLTIGRATYEPGWHWATHVGRKAGLALCPVEHVGMVLRGAATAEFADGSVALLRAGNLFHIPPVPHDSRVVGDEPYVSLHFLGTEAYAKKDASAAAPAPAATGRGFEPYRPRRRRFHGLRHVEGHRLKLYSIAYDDRRRPVRLESFEKGLALAFATLPTPAVASGRPGVGFAIAHQGRGADYAVIAWWDRENELPIRVFVRTEAEETWRAARGGESVCVWDLDLIHAERDAYVATVLTSGDVEAYAARHE